VHSFILLLFTFYILIQISIILCSPSDDKGWASENKEIELLFPTVVIAKTDYKLLTFSDTLLEVKISKFQPLFTKFLPIITNWISFWCLLPEEPTHSTCTPN
jgi:hypothetical protein